MLIAGILIFLSLAVLLAGLQKDLEKRFCMTDCCSPTSWDPETNGKCWDCYGTGHTHLIAENGRVL